MDEAVRDSLEAHAETLWAMVADPGFAGHDPSVVRDSVRRLVGELLEDDRPDVVAISMQAFVHLYGLSLAAELGIGPDDVRLPGALSATLVTLSDVLEATPV